MLIAVLTLLLLIASGMCILFSVACMAISAIFAASANRYRRILVEHWDMKVIMLPNGSELINAKITCPQDEIDADNDLQSMRRNMQRARTLAALSRRALTASVVILIIWLIYSL